MPLRAAMEPWTTSNVRSELCMSHWPERKSVRAARVAQMRCRGCDVLYATACASQRNRDAVKSQLQPLAAGFGMRRAIFLALHGCDDRSLCGAGDGVVHHGTGCEAGGDHERYTSF